MSADTLSSSMAIRTRGYIRAQPPVSVTRAVKERLVVPVGLMVRVAVSIKRPMVGMVVFVSEVESLCRRVDLPALSRPIMEMLVVGVGKKWRRMDCIFGGGLGG